MIDNEEKVEHKDYINDVLAILKLYSEDKISAACCYTRLISLSTVTLYYHEEWSKKETIENLVDGLAKSFKKREDELNAKS